MPFEVLLVGEGNFSFACSLATSLWGSNSSCRDDRYLNALSFLELPSWFPSKSIHLTATSFDSIQDLLSKYPESKAILTKLCVFPENVAVLHDINAWQLSAHFPGTNFNSIVWNHPHLGTEDFRLHRFLLSHFFHSAASVLSEKKYSLQVDGSLDIFGAGALTSALSIPLQSLDLDPFVCISLVRGQEISWKLTEQAQRANLQLTSSTPPSAFHERRFDGYVCKRNKTGASFKNAKTKRHVARDMTSFIYKFFKLSAGLVLTHVECPFIPPTHENHSPLTREGPYPHTPLCSQSTTDDVLSTQLQSVLIFPQSAPPPSASAQPFETVNHSLPSAATTSSTVDVITTTTVLFSSDIFANMDRKKRKTLYLDLEGRDFQCSVCLKHFSTLWAVQQHHHIIHELNLFASFNDSTTTIASSITCTFPKCSRRTFTHPRDLQQHQISAHNSFTREQWELIACEESNHLETACVGLSSSGGVSSNCVDFSDPNQNGAASPVTEISNHPLPLPNDNSCNVSVSTIRKFYPCNVCGQAVLEDKLGMALHLESLKPIIGLKMKCPWCHATSPHKSYSERRALEQHCRRCRWQQTPSTASNDSPGN